MDYVNFWKREITLAVDAETATLDLPDGTYALVISDTLGAGASAHEIVIADVASGTATLQRAQEGTEAQAWPAGSVVYCALTAGQLARLPLLTRSNFVERVRGGALGDADGYAFYHADIGACFNTTVGDNEGFSIFPWIGSTLSANQSHKGFKVGGSEVGAGCTRVGPALQLTTGTVEYGGAAIGIQLGAFAGITPGIQPDEIDSMYLATQINAPTASTEAQRFQIMVLIQIPGYSSVGIKCRDDINDGKPVVSYDDTESAEVVINSARASMNGRIRATLVSGVLQIRGDSGPIYADVPLADLQPSPGQPVFGMNVSIYKESGTSPRLLTVTGMQGVLTLKP